MPRGNTVTSAMYADLLKNHLRLAIMSKQHGLLSTDVLLQHDNARPHTARSTVATIQYLSFECLPHPLYSPDLASSDFHVFGPLKEAMEGKSFRSDEEVQQAMNEWLCCQPKDFFLEVSTLFRGVGTLVWNTMKTAQKNDVVMYLLRSVNCEINNISGFPLTHPSYTVVLV